MNPTTNPGSHARVNEPRAILRNALVTMAVLSGIVCSAFGQAGSSNSSTVNDATKAWLTLYNVSHPPAAYTPPGTTKSAEARELDRRNTATAYLNASDQARDFYTKYSADPNAKEAKKLEATNLLRAVDAGDKSQAIKAQQIGRAFREDKTNPNDHRFEVAVLMNHQRVRDVALTDPKAAMVEYEKSARGLMGEFTNVPDAYDFLWGVARNSPPDRAKAIAGELLLLASPERVKIEARRLLERYAMVGKPAALNFTADDGSDFDLQKQKGKMTVIYVWGNISQGSLAAVPKIKNAVKPNVTFIGVNLDTDIAAAKATARRESLPGIQVYDAEGLNGAPARQLQLGQIPAVYVVDSKGILQGFGSPDELIGLLAAAK